MTMHWDVVWENWPRFMEGAGVTILLTVVTMAISIPGGLILAFLRLSRFRMVRTVSTAFVEFFRATPLILQIYWTYYVLPECWAAEVCKGFDYRLIARAMIERGWMEPGDGKNLARRIRVPGAGTPRLYSIRAAFLEGDADADR